MRDEFDSALWQTEETESFRGVKKYFQSGNAAGKDFICVLYVCTHTSAHRVCVCVAVASVRLWLLLIQSPSREPHRCVCFPGTYQAPAPVCSWASGCCGCAGTVPSVDGPSRRSGWDARPVCSGSRTRRRSLLCDTPALDSWHSPRRWRQIWEEETDKESGMLNNAGAEGVK